MQWFGNGREHFRGPERMARVRKGKGGAFLSLGAEVGFARNPQFLVGREGTKSLLS